MIWDFGQNAYKSQDMIFRRYDLKIYIVGYSLHNDSWHEKNKDMES